ncbi:cytochrome C heme lyase [Vibrio sp. HN007]|uniref:TPR domain-containing protein n=1 Tax=Vibrio iocasae TaxID=3098914 RepID=UPI0035D47DEC
MPILVLSLSAVVLLAVFYIYFSKNHKLVKPLTLGVAVAGLSCAVWYSTLDQSQELAQAQSKAEEKIAAEPKTVKELIEQIENKLREDRNNSELWYELGHGYLSSNRFEEASQCFSYVLRLEESPTASVFSAKATADYYANSQRISKNIQLLLDEALSMDEYNYPALMLIGNDHFISFRYQEAIETWQKILDSERQGLDRSTVINSINRAKDMMK